MNNNKGFTLVELMVVLLIIGILMAVAVPVFLGARTKAQNNAANQAMVNAARAVAAERSAGTSMPSVGYMATVEPAYSWTTDTSTGPSVVQYNPTTGAISVKSDSGANYATAVVAPSSGAITQSRL